MSTEAAGKARTDLIQGLLAAAVVVAVWTSFLLISRHAATRTLNGFDLTALRLACAGLVTLPLLRRHGLGGLRPWQALVLILTAGLGFPLFAYHAFMFAPTAHAGILMPGSLPLWTALLTVLVLRERLTARRLVALSLTMAGILCLAANLGDAPPGTWRGDLLFSCASISWSIYTIAIRAWRVGPLVAVGIVAVGGAALFLPVYIVLLPKGIGDTGLPEILFQAFYQGVLSVIVALIAYTRAVMAIGPGPTTMITSLVPALAAVLAVPLLGEPLTSYSIFGLVLVTVGMLAGVAGLRSTGAR